MPKHKLQKLAKIVTKRSELASVQHGSHAVVPICLWVEALVDYHKAKVVVQPYRERLTEAERILMDVRMASFFFFLFFFLSSTALHACMMRPCILAKQYVNLLYNRELRLIDCS